MAETAETILSRARTHGTDWVTALEAAIDIRRAALDQLDPGLTDTVGVDLRNDLGVDLSARYRAAGRLPDLLEACALGHATLEASEARDPDDFWVSAVANLAGRLSMLARHSGYESSLDEAVRLAGRALQRASGPNQRGTAVGTFAGISLHRWQLSGDLGQLADAVTTIERENTAAGSPQTILNVTGLWLEYAQETGDEGLADQAVQRLRSTLEDDEAQPADRLGLARALADALSARFERNGGRPDLEEALGWATAALADPYGGPERSGRLASRALIRAALARLDADRQGLDAAVVDAREALQLVDRAGIDRSEALNTVAILLAERYDMLGDGTDLDESIQHLEQILAAASVAADVRAAVLTNLATQLQARLERDGDGTDLDRAVSLAEDAVATTNPASAHLAARHDTAGRIWAAIAFHRQDDDALVTAERHAQAATDLVEDASADKALYLNNWARWVTDRWEATGSTDALDRAIELLEQALAVVAGESMRGTIMFNLGARLHERFDHRLTTTGRHDWDELQRACDLLDDVLAVGQPHLTLPAGKRLGDIAWRMSMWPEAEHALRLALAAAGELTGSRPRRPDQERARSGVQGLGALAALAAIRAGNEAGAALHLEQASATLMAEALGVRARTLTLDDVVAAASRARRNIVMLASTPDSGIAVRVDPDATLRAFELPSVTDATVDEVTTSFRRILAAAGVPESTLGSIDDPLDACYQAAAELVRWTWTAVLEPLEQLLTDAGPLAVLALGRLSWLPLAAAGPPGAAPALSAHAPVFVLRVTGYDHPAVEESEDAPVGRIRSTAPAVVVWADTGPAERSIPGVIDEARQVAAAHPGASLSLRDRTEDAEAVAVPLRSATGLRTHDQFVDANVRATAVANLLAADLAHLACHCDLDLERPWDSVIQVDPPIRIGDLEPAGDARAHIVLSACDAALTASSLPDEAISPATALLLAGAETVTAPVWPVDDEDGGEFIIAYHHALAAGEAPAPALARLQASWSSDRPAFLYAPWLVVSRRLQ